MAAPWEREENGLDTNWNDYGKKMNGELGWLQVLIVVEAKVYRFEHIYCEHEI